VQGGHDAGGEPVELRVIDLEEYRSKGADEEAAADDNSTGSEIGRRGAHHADGDGAGRGALLGHYLQRGGKMSDRAAWRASGVTCV
jgi:hypothetical protein